MVAILALKKVGDVMGDVSNIFASSAFFVENADCFLKIGAAILGTLQRSPSYG